MSAITKDTTDGPEGSGGEMFINTGTLEMRDGRRISARTEGTRDSGFINVEANSIVINGRGFDELNARIFAVSDNLATGDAGAISLTSNALEILERVLK